MSLLTELDLHQWYATCRLGLQWVRTTGGRKQILSTVYIFEHGDGY